MKSNETDVQEHITEVDTNVTGNFRSPSYTIKAMEKLPNEEFIINFSLHPRRSVRVCSGEIGRVEKAQVGQRLESRGRLSIFHMIRLYVCWRLGLNANKLTTKSCGLLISTVVDCYELVNKLA